MKHKALQDLIGRAIVDRDFREDLVSGNRDGAVSDFDLSQDELDAIRSIDAGSFEELAGQLDDWIAVRNGSAKRQRSSLLGIFK
jgi:hypothetical protein